MNLSDLGSRRWIVTGTRVDQPYPCRCEERRGDRCSPKWCPCAGRLDLANVPDSCCANWYGPDAYLQAWAERR